MFWQATQPVYGVQLSWRQVWTRILVRPSVQSFEEILTDPAASARRAYRWIVLTALLGVAIANLSQLPVFLSIFTPPSTAPNNADIAVVRTGLGVVFLVCSVAMPILMLLEFVIEVFILHLLAKVIGGQGQYEWLVYAAAAYSAPWILIQTVFNLVSPSTNLVTVVILPLFLYRILLHIIAVKTVHQFGWLKASFSVLFFPVVLILAGLFLTKSLGFV